MGICLGTQIILDYSEENDTNCIGLVAGSTKRFPDKLTSDGQALKIPHMGWNSVTFSRSHPVFQDISPDAEFYFVHSYYPAPSDESAVLGITDYGMTFCSVLASEKSCGHAVSPGKKRPSGLTDIEEFLRVEGQCLAKE